MVINIEGTSDKDRDKRRMKRLHGLLTSYPGNDQYQYFGCYNETTAVNGTGGKRALYGGSMESLDIMTANLCLNFCNGDGFKYAGLEYAK